MHAVACLGYSRNVYQSAEITMDTCEAGKFILACPGAVAQKGRDSPKKELTQRAIVGNCPCCARATHAAIPARETLGEYSGLKGRGLALRMPEGPRAGRQLAVRHYVKDSGGTPLPNSGDGLCRILEAFPCRILGCSIFGFRRSGPLCSNDPFRISSARWGNYARRLFLDDEFSGYANSNAGETASTPSFAPPPQSPPSGPCTVNLSERVFMPVSPGNWASTSQMAPFERIRIKRSKREKSGDEQVASFRATCSKMEDNKHKVQRLIMNRWRRPAI